MNRFRAIVPLGLLILFVLLFFHPFIVSKKLPIPADTIVGLYHPFRDLYAKNYPNGIPYKNFLITDPVRQQYPWRNLVIENFRDMQLPLWNPYNFSGTPLLANMQSAPFYPLNVLFFFLPFTIAWSLLIVLQPLLAAVFLYLYLRNIKISYPGSVLGALTFAFSGFFIAWLEWGTVLHVALWLPLILLAIDQVVASVQYKVFSIRNKRLILWSSTYIVALTSSFFAGHIQTFFYLFLVSQIYFIVRILQNTKKMTMFALYILLNTSYLLLSFVQWYPTLQLILLSARDIDQANWQQIGWFIPWQHVIQFISPDFFGNPATLNYWSDWNYAEFVGYVGIVPLSMAIFALFFRKDKKTLFFGTLLFAGLFLAFSTPLAKLPFIFSLPFVSTAQPTRLLFIIDFSLAVLAAFGMDYFLKQPRKIGYTFGVMFFFFGSLWVFVLYGQQVFPTASLENLDIAKRNLILPTSLLIGSLIICCFVFMIPKRKYATIFLWILVLIAGFDLFRFGTKFTPFTEKAFLFPTTKTIAFLQRQKGEFRIMATDSRILPPNFSTAYRIQSVDGYDPLYVKQYGELIAASERKKPDISAPFGFNRIITPHNYNSKIIDLLNVKYVLSLSDIDSIKFKKVFQEGETRIYENRQVLPRTFFVKETKLVHTKQENINHMMNLQTNLLDTAIIESGQEIATWSLGTAVIERYEANKVIIRTDNAKKGFLVLTDMYYPSWNVTIDGKESDIVRTDYLVRGVVVPAGKHTIIFYTGLL